jgi:hypothetical protein
MGSGKQIAMVPGTIWLVALYSIACGVFALLGLISGLDRITAWGTGEFIFLSFTSMLFVLLVVPGWLLTRGKQWARNTLIVLYTANLLSAVLGDFLPVSLHFSLIGLAYTTPGGGFHINIGSALISALCLATLLRFRPDQGEIKTG